MDGCEQYREAISARLDAEPHPLDVALVDAHLGACRACAEFASQAVELDRQVALQQMPVEDRTAAILLSLGPQPDVGRLRRLRGMRGLLGLAGVVQLTLGVPALLALGDGADHLLRELGAWQVALAGALLLVAWRPRAATGLLPMVGLVAAVSAVAAVLDVIAGTATLVGELAHLTPLVAAWPLRELAQAQPLPQHSIAAP